MQNYDDTQWNTVKSQLGTLGVRYFRDGLELVDNATYKARMQDLYDSYGMKMLAVCGPYGNNNLQPTSTGSFAGIVDKVAAIKPFLQAVEGPNEPDIFWFDGWNYGGFTDRPSQVVWYQNNLYNAIKADSRTNDVQVATTALARVESYDNLGWTGSHPVVRHDILAWHYYNGRNQPTAMDTINKARNALSSDPAVTPAYLTEHGYRIRGDGNVTQKAQMKLNTRSMAYFLNSWDVNGNTKIFFYVAGIDNAAGEDYGLANGDFTPRPTYTAMKNVISYMKEGTWNTSSKTWTKPSFTPGALDYTITGDTGQYGFRLYQKSTGEFYLMALPYIQVSNQGDGSDITNSTHAATLNFPGNQPVKQYKCDDNGNYTETTLTIGATTVNVTLDDTLMIFKIGSGGATPTPTPAPTGNLVTNPGFEFEQFNTQTPSAWSEAFGDAGASFTEDYGGAHGGSYHGTHYGTSAYKIYTYQTITGLVNGLYTLKAWVKSSGGQNWCQMEAKDYGSSASVYINPAGNWTQLTIPDINVTNGQCTVGFWSDANAGNWIHFDDIEFFNQSAGNCLTGYYYDNMDFTGTMKSHLDKTVNFNWGTASPIAGISPNTYSVRWKGYVIPKYTQAYTFYTTTDDGVRLWVNGTKIIDKWVNQGATEYTSTTVNLTAGQKYPIVMQYFQNTGGASAKLSWKSASQVKEIVPDASTLPDDGKVVGGT